MGASNETLIARDILSYLLAHTAAEDTIEGIVDWWLLEEQIRRRKKEVQKVVDELVSENLLCKCKSKDSRIRYRVNLRKMSRIRAILE